MRIPHYPADRARDEGKHLARAGRELGVVRRFRITASLDWRLRSLGIQGSGMWGKPSEVNSRLSRQHLAHSQLSNYRYCHDAIRLELTHAKPR